MFPEHAVALARKQESKVICRIMLCSRYVNQHGQQVVGDLSSCKSCSTRPGRAGSALQPPTQLHSGEKNTGSALYTQPDVNSKWHLTSSSCFRHTQARRVSKHFRFLKKSPYRSKVYSIFLTNFLTWRDHYNNLKMFQKATYDMHSMYALTKYKVVSGKFAKVYTKLF